MVSVLLSTVVSTIVNWFIGPRQAMRQETARRRLELCRRITRVLEELNRRLRNEVLRQKALERGGHAISKWTTKECERLLRPSVRSLDDPDLGKRLAKKLREGFRDLLGRSRLEYLSIYETDDLENALDTLEPRHVEDPQGLLLFSPSAGSAPVAKAVSRVEELIKLLN